MHVTLVQRRNAVVARIVHCMPYNCMASIAFRQASQLAFSILIVWVGGQVVAQVVAQVILEH